MTIAIRTVGGCYPRSQLALGATECQGRYTERVPTYDYRCENGHTEEVIQRMTEDPLTECRECGAPTRRVLHPVAIHFKGKGFYNTDYGRAKTAKSDGSATNESGSAKDAGASSGGGGDAGSGSNTSTADSSSSGGKGSSSGGVSGASSTGNGSSSGSSSSS